MPPVTSLIDICTVDTDTSSDDEPAIDVTRLRYVPSSGEAIVAAGATLSNVNVEPRGESHASALGPIPPASLHPGVVWKDPSLQAAAKLAQLLAPTWSKLRMESIVAPNRTDMKSDPSKITLKLQANGGSQL